MRARGALLKAVLPILLLFAISTHLGASDLPDTVKGFKPQTLEVYLDRADQERAATDWERVAQFGAEASISQWERDAVQLYGDAGEIQQARTQLTSWVGAQMQERYDSWLVKQFFDRQGSLGTDAVRRAINDANLQYLYTTDASGNVALDEKGDPILKGADLLSDDRAAWRGKIDQATDAALASWEQKVDQAFAPELGDLLSGDSLSRYEDYKVGMKAGLQREMERVALQGELSLVSRRTYDQYSLRKKSESATADAVADQIVRETRLQTDAGIKQIEAGLSATPEAVDTSTSAIDVEKWQESFMAVFESGLSRWDEAEQKFLASRMEWEQDAGKSYTEGEQAWAAAFQRLTTERKSWETQVSALLDTGAQRWVQQQSDLSVAIESARAEFLKESAERVSGMQDQVGALVEMYAQSQQVIATAVSSGQALIKRLDIKNKETGEYVRFGSSSLAAIEQSRKDTWDGYVGELNRQIVTLRGQKVPLWGRLSDINDDLDDLQSDFPADPSQGIVQTSMDITVTSSYEVVLHITETDLYRGTTATTTTTVTPGVVAAYKKKYPGLCFVLDKYFPLAAEGAQARTSLQELDREIAPLQSLVDAMGAAQPGPLMQDESPDFATARGLYREHLSDESPFNADVFAAVWERYNRLKDWLNIIDTYSADAVKAQQELTGALGIAFGAEATDLRDVLKTDGASGVSFLDEYQLELLRAKAIQDYWTQKQTIADAVVKYAVNLTSGRETEDRSAKDYDSARNAYKAQLDSYNAIVDDLKARGNDLSKARQDLETAQQAADAASAQYDEARDKYLQALAVAQSGNVEFYQDQIKQKYSELLKASGMTESDSELADASREYFAAARHYGYDLAVQDAWGSVSELIHGDVQSGMPSLQSLKSGAGAIQVPAAVDSIPSTIDQLGVAADSASFSQISALYSAWHDAAPGDARDLAGWKLVGFVRLLKADAQAAYNERLAEIKAHGAVDSESWYSEAGGHGTVGALADRLSADSMRAQLALIAARAGTEKSGLEAWLLVHAGQAPAESDATVLARAAPPGLRQAEAEARVGALRDLEAVLQGFDVDPVGSAARLRDKVEAGGWIQSFVAGRGTFMDETAGDLVLGLCMPQFEEAARANGLVAAWNNASWDSTALVAERETSVIDSIKEVFSSQGFAMASGSVLPSSEAIAAWLASQGTVDAVAFVADLGVELGQASSAGPQWLQDRVKDYTDSLASYVVAATVKGGAAQASTRAGAAMSAASTARADQGDLQSVSAQLDGTGRLAALVGLSTRSDAPSAFAVSARSIIMESAAIQVARRSLADTGQTLAQIATELVPGLSGSLASQIAQRATELLQTNAGSDLVGQRVAAYRLWSADSAKDAVAGVAVKPNASRFKELWDAVDAVGWGDPSAVSGAIDSYLSGFAPGSAPQELIDLCQKLQSGVFDRDQLFRTALFGPDFDSLMASFNAMGATGDVYRRATALRIASLQEGSDQGRALARFLWDRTGVPHAEDAESFAGMGDGIDLDSEALAGASDLSLEYLCKSLLLQGLPIENDVSDRLSAAPKAVRDEVDAFEATLRAARGYIPVLDGNASHYVASLGGDVSAQSSLAASLATGQWDDEIFAASAGSSYLDWRQGVIDASLDSAVQVIQAELSQRASALARASFQRTTEASYWRQVQDQSNAPASWRGYLLGSNVGDDSPVAVAAAAQTRDSGSYTRNTDQDRNGVLDAFNELARQERAFSQQLSADTGDRAAVNKFHDFLAQFTSGTAEETDLPAISEQGLGAAQGRYQTALSRIQALKDDIKRSGASLDILNLGTDSREEMLTKRKKDMEDLDTLVSSTQAAADTALTDFGHSGDVYNNLYAQLQASEEQLATARVALRVQQEISDWASSGYLASNGDVVSGYQSPLQNQQAVDQHLAKATAAVDALEGLFGGAAVGERPIEDAATLAAYESWKSSYTEMMRLEQVSGELNAATAEQQDKVHDLATKLDQARNDILDGSLAFQSIANIDKQELSSWSSYLVVQDGKLVLNVDSGYGLVAQIDQDAVDSLRNFFQKSTKQADGSAATGFEQQMAWFVDYVQKNDMATLMDRWGFAADWLKRQLYDKNTKMKATIGSAYASNAGMVDQKWLDFRAAGEHTTEVGEEWADAAYNIAYQQYAAVMGSPEEKAAFEFYFAMRAATGREGADSSQFHTRTYATLMNTLYNFLDQRYGHYRRLARDHGLLSGISGSKQDRDEYDQLRTECDNTIKSFQRLSDSNDLQTESSVFLSARDALEASTTRLAELQGTGAPLASFDAFLDQYCKMQGERKGIAKDSVSVDPDLKAQLSKAWDSLKPEDRTSFSTALQKMTQAAEARNTDAESNVKVALAMAQSEFAGAQKDYLSTYNAFLEGQVNAQALEDSAAKAYRDSAWVARTEQELTTGVLFGASFTKGPLTDVEMQARMAAVQSYGRAIITAYASSLDARHVAAEQQWNQSMADLVDQSNTWIAQTKLMQAKSVSAWDASIQKLGRSITAWRQGFQEQYTAKSEAWRLSYLNFGQEKLQWVQQLGAKAAQAGNEAILSEVGASADDAMRSASTPMIASMSFDAREANLQVEGLLGEVGSAQALTALRRMNAGIPTGQVVVASAGLGVDTRGARVMAEVKRFLADSRTEMAGMAAREIADQAQDSLVQAKKALAESVQKANEGFAGSMNYTFANAGYATSSGSYAREAIVRTTFMDVITEHQKVEGYRPYAMPVVQISVNLSQSRLQGLGSEAVMDLVGVAQGEVSQAQKKIFGEGKDLSEEQKRNKGLVFDVSANDKTVRKEFGEGEFGRYIGYTPEFTDEPDFDKSESRNIVVKGSGELGRLMGDFIWNQMKEGRGWSEMALPRWDKPLWDDSGSWFKAPTLRTVGTIASGIAATVLTGGIGGIAGVAAAATVSTASTALFDTMDVAYGYKSWEEAGLDVGKSFLTSAATSAVGGVFNGFDPAKVGGIAGSLGKFGQGAVGKAMVAGARTFTTNVATSAINSINLGGDWGLTFDTHAFAKGAIGTGSLASAAGSMAGAYTTTKLGGMLDPAGNKFYGGAVGLAGGAATELARYGTYAASEYAYGGSGSLQTKLARAYDDMGGVTVNVANAGAILDMLGTGIANNTEGGQSGLGKYGQLLSGTGLVELNIGRNGVRGSVGTSGTDVMGGVYRLAKGAADRSILENYIASDNERGTIAWNAYVFGDWTAENTARRLGNGKDQLMFGFDGANGKIDDNTKGYTQTNGKGGRTIFLKDGGTEPGSLLNMAVMLQHEAYRNGVVDADNGLETYRAVTAHTIMVAQFDKRLLDSELQNDVDAYKKGDAAFRQYVGDTYDSSSDYWKAVKTDRGVGWIADGKTTFDVSDVLEGGGTALASLDQATIQQLWQVQQGVISGTIEGGAAVSDSAGVFYRPEFADFAAFSGAMLQYNIASMKINSTMAIVDEKEPDPTAVRNALTGVMNSLQAVQGGGLLVKTDAAVVDAGPGVNIFASGGNGSLSSSFGIRPETWVRKTPIADHTGLDVSSKDPRLVAPDSGSLSLLYTENGGLATQFTDTDLLNREVVRHTDPASLLQFLGDFGMIGTTLNAGVLNGIQKNMVIGQIGNTGTKTTGAHGHVEYYQWDSDQKQFSIQNPLYYYNTGNFSSISFDARMISGWNSQVTTANVISAWEYSQLPLEKTGQYLLKFDEFRNNPENQKWFSEVDWGEVDRHVYLEMQRRHGR